jgi:plastocyanin domain-containing protein
MILHAGQTTTIDFTADNPGTYQVTCSMNMYQPATLRVS